MANHKESIEINLLGNTFSVLAGEDEGYIREISTFVNSQLKEISEKNPHTNPIRIALLGCMNIAELLFQSKENMLDIEKKQRDESKYMESMEDRLQSSQSVTDSLKEDIANLENEKKSFEKILNEKEDLLNQYREHLKQAKLESESNRKSILDLQNQLFESQIELSKIKDN